MKKVDYFVTSVYFTKIVFNFNWKGIFYPFLPLLFLFSVGTFPFSFVVASEISHCSKVLDVQQKHFAEFREQLDTLRASNPGLTWKNYSRKIRGLEDFDFDDVDRPDVVRYIRKISRLRNRIEASSELLEKARQIRTVFYAFAGNDSIYPLTLFPDARVVIALDANPFVKDIDLPIRVQSTDHAADHRDWYVYYEVEQEAYYNGVAPQLLGGILQAFPKSKILEMVELKSKSGLSSGFIQFEDAQGNRRLYVHLCASVDEQSQLKDFWWKALIRFDQFALIEKASMTFNTSKLGQEIFGKMVHGQNSSAWGPTEELATPLKNFPYRKVAVLEEAAGWVERYGSLSQFSAFYPSVNKGVPAP